MREFSDKEMEQFYKEEKLKDIPDLWKNIEGNLAPKSTTTDVVKQTGGQTKKKRFPLRWIGGMAAVLAVAALAIPGWQLLQGGTKSYDNSSAAMESPEAEFQGEMDKAADLMGPAGNLHVDGESPEGADGESPEGADGESPAEADGEILTDGENPSEISEGNAGQAAKGEENEFHREVELNVEQVQTTMEGFLVTGVVLSAEDHWFEAGEKVTLFYEGTAYAEEDFSGRLHVMVDVEEENLKILEILP